MAKQKIVRPEIEGMPNDQGMITYAGPNNEVRNAVTMSEELGFTPEAQDNWSPRGGYVMDDGSRAVPGDVDAGTPTGYRVGYKPPTGAKGDPFAGNYCAMDKG